MLQDSETRASAIDVKDLANHPIDKPVYVSCPDSIAVSIDSDKAPPGSIVTALEDHSCRARIHNRVSPAPKEQAFELTRCRSQGRRTPDLSKVREGCCNDDRHYYERQNSFDQ